jgi:hypothetical protein
VTVTAAAGLAVGVYPIVLRANSQFLAEKTTNLSVNVVAPSGSGNASVSFATCSAINKAVWLAFMDGTGGTWTAVTGVGDVYQFNITQSKGSFAYATLGGTGNPTIFVQHLTQAEITAGPFNLCPTATVPNTRIANGTYSNLPANFLGNISFGGGSAIAVGTAAGPFQITNAMNTGTFDLVAFAKPLAGSGGERAFIKRGENPAPAGNFSVDVNFTGANSDAAASAAATLNGLTGTETAGLASVNFYTGGTACVLASLYSSLTIPASFTLYGVPASLRSALTDMHSLNILVANGTTSNRTLLENYLDPVARAATPFVCRPSFRCRSRPTPAVPTSGPVSPSPVCLPSSTFRT